MYDKDAEVEISWGLFHKEKKTFFRWRENRSLNQHPCDNGTFTWEQLKIAVLVFSFLIYQHLFETKSQNL